ncbi:ABC transporter substrate-binding protein [Clostridium folliculivorans]|uniref:ABC transporter substrate-binding protein n=1 Tax=Clostridium folliculivorans TaxID=2886038 RepID=A0A9W5Y6F3_9CLOT|nr:ABC transporter substrate-binding protein [Clostridium folliculivorans]GKU27523.1 ABC transporter substrate-binding protein [Clostridium folliculivorans]GKU32372.1 ABC transporter substrate-binding protein [Clostridium folliculivorans]
MKTKKLLSVICVMAVALSTMVGCGSNSATNGSKSGKAEVTLIQNKVEIQTELEAAAKQFNESQKDVEVKILGSAGDNLVTTLQSQFASSPAKAPTIFTCGSGSEFEKFFKYMAPMDSAASAKIIAKGQADDTTKDGKLYGLPLAVEGIGLVYNKQIFKDAGVDAASIKTMDDLTAACEKISKVKGVVKPLAFAKETYFQFMHPFNWPFATMNNYKDSITKVSAGQLNLKDIPEVKKYAQDLEKLKPYTNLAKDSYDDQVAGFSQGKYAIIHQGNWSQSIIDQYKVSFDYGMMPMPANGNASLAVGNTNFFHVNNAATKEQQDGAIKFLDWLFTTKDGQKIVTDKFKVIPAYTGFDTSNLSVLSKEVSKYSDAGKTIPWTFNLFPAGVDKDCTSAMEKFYAGQINSDQLLDEIQKVWTNAAKK